MDRPRLDAMDKATAELDTYDSKILQMLVADGRISWRDLADRIGLSLTPTLRRVRRLERDGYIEGYAAILDEKQMAGSLSIFVMLTLERQSEEMLGEFEREINDFPEVISCFMTTGSTDYLLRVVVHDLDHYQHVLRRLTGIRSIAHVNSIVSLKSIVRRRGFHV